VNKIASRAQRTIAAPAEVAGIGYLTGARVRLRFLPAPPSSGVVFVRADLRSRPQIPAHVSCVTGTQRRTTLGHAPAQVSLVEHVLGALAGLRIDNCVVELDAPEPPGLDGSCQAFVDALYDAELVLQSASRVSWSVDESLLVTAGGATLALHPAEGPGLRMTYFLDYGLTSPIARQSHTIELTPSTFAEQIACCRTFLLEEEAIEMRRQGFGKHTTPRDLVVFGPHGPIDNQLRFANEPARHKVLDMIGDLSLLGADLCGHVIAYRSGHPLNVEMVRALYQRLPGCGVTRAAA
jgi:UDP-3-O-acyl N-acetylglucosamine deacetylase